MTPLRRELPLSRSASQRDPKTRRRIASARPPPIVVPASRRGAPLEKLTITLCPCLPRCLRRLESTFSSRHGRPDESDQLTRNRSHGDQEPFAVADERAIATVKRLLRVPRLSDNRRRLPRRTGWPARGRPWADRSFSTRCRQRRTLRPDIVAAGEQVSACFLDLVGHIIRVVVRGRGEHDASLLHS